MADKSSAEVLKEKLLISRKNGYQRIDEDTVKKIYSFCEDYKTFLDSGKTEREVVKYTVDLVKRYGFVEYERGKRYKPGDKVYYVNRNKAVILAVMGQEPVEKGVRLAAAHIDSPRLDLKPNPLYEDYEQALFKTHYYGGIKKYQWTAIPLALHGVVVKKDGSAINIAIGEKPGEPQFCVTDLLPHLAADQMKKTMAEGIKGEALNILIGSRPLRSDKGSELVKLNIMRILNEQYGILEEDFLSAELEAVPAFKASDIGFDRSLIGSYGQDDRVCAWAAVMATVATERPRHTVVTVLADKEEVGSDGNTGLASAFLKYFIEDLAESQGSSGRTALSNSRCLSVDVNSAFDSNYPEVNEKQNAAYINYGVVITKYTGSRGKAGTSDASAEFMGEIRGLLDRHNVVWQTGELGKVDQGGGGTVAKFIANMNVDVVDVGVPVLSMHSPFEVVAKLDLYMTYRAICAFYSE